MDGMQSHNCYRLWISDLLSNEYVCFITNTLWISMVFATLFHSKQPVWQHSWQHWSPASVEDVGLFVEELCLITQLITQRMFKWGIVHPPAFCEPGSFFLLCLGWCAPTEMEQLCIILQVHMLIIMETADLNTKPWLFTAYVCQHTSDLLATFPPCKHQTWEWSPPSLNDHP